MALAKALRRLIERPDEPEADGEGGRRQELAEFSVEIVVRQSLAVYKALVRW